MSDVPGYETLGELGRGGMGVVYKAYQTSLKRVVALKMILAGGHAGPTAHSRFRLEAESVARLQHPNIVQVYEIGEQEGRPYFSLEYVNGGSLAQRLAGTPFPAHAAAELAQTLARTVHYAHQQGIIHRDLKPANILLHEPAPAGGESASGGPDRQNLPALVPKITDFGLAKQLEADARHTQTGAIVGSPSYMAPEQAAGEVKDIGPLADVYSLGAILYETLTGRPPFRGTTVFETLEQVRTQEPVPPSRLQSKVPRDLELICLKCLQKEARRRYASAGALADDLQRFLGGEPVEARPVGVGERIWKWARRRKTAAALIVVCVAALVSLFALILGYNAYLETEVKRAQAEARLAALRADAQQDLLAAEQAINRENWTLAEAHLLQAAEKSSEPGLADLASKAEASLRGVRVQLTDLNARQAVQARFQEFRKLRETTRFHATLSTGMSPAENLHKARTGAQQALELVASAGEGLAYGSPYLSDGERREFREGVYELRLILADVLLYPTPNQTQDDDQERAKQALAALDAARGLAEPSKTFHHRRQRCLSRLGDERGAREEQALADQLQPSTVIDYFLLGDESYKKGDLLQAIRHFERALLLQPDHFWSQYLTAVCYLKLQRPAEAKASLSACLSQRDNFGWLYLFRGYAHAQLREFELAENDFRRAAAVVTDDLERYALFVNRGVARVRQQRLEEAVADFRAALQLRPDQYQAYLNLAKALEEQGRSADALAQLDDGIRRAPAEPALRRERARLNLQRHDLDAARLDLEEAIRLHGEVDDHVGLGRILRQQKRHEDALQAYQAAIALRPDYGIAHLLRAEALLALAESQSDRQEELRYYAAAIEAFDRYLQRGAPSVDVYRARGIAHAKLGKHAEAIEDFTLALRVQSIQEPGRRPWVACWGQSASGLAPPTGLGGTLTALASAAFARAEGESIAALHAQRGWVYLAVDAGRLARDDFAAVLRLRPESGEAYAGRGQAFAKIGDYAAAVADADEAVRRGPRSASLLYSAARTYALAVGQVRADARQPQSYNLSVRFGDRALELVGAALASLPQEQRIAFWKKHVQEDGALDALRGDPRFAQLDRAYSRPD